MNKSVRAGMVMAIFLLFCSWSAIAYAGDKDEQIVRRYLAQSETLMLNNLDSALTQALKAKEKLKMLPDVELRIEVLNRLGDIYKYKGDHATSMNYYLQSKSIVENALRKPTRKQSTVNLQLLRADVSTKIGTLYLQRRSYRKSLLHMENALSVLEVMDPKSQEVVLRKLKVYNNMAAVFIQQQDYNTALVYFRNALELNKIIKDPGYEGAILNNIGICHLEKRELDLSSHYFHKSLKIRQQSGDVAGQAQVLNNLGKNEVFLANFQQANVYFEQSLALSRKTGNNESALVSLESLSLVQDTLGNYREALRYYREFKELNDRIFNNESKTAIVTLEDAHKRENEKKAYQLQLQQNEADASKAQARIFGLIAALLVALLIIISMRGRIKTARLKQENLDLTRRKLEENLEFKERELTAKALVLLQNNELISRITDSLNKAKYSFSKENQHLVQEIINDLRSGQHNSAWEEFEAHFTKVHTQFYLALQDKFPTLTSNEMKLCAFLRLNMSTKDISSITNQSVNSITVARSRLRKKLGIDGEDVHLINFLIDLEQENSIN